MQFVHNNNSVDYESLEEWFDIHDYKYKPYWAKGPKEPFPRNLVVISPIMHENYSKYGDMLSFELIYDCLTNKIAGGSSYQLGVFTVMDTN
jgi:hypothetical protein